MKQRSAGFTLIEILTAVVIFSLLSIGAYTVLDAGMRSQRQTEDRLDKIATLQRAIQTMEKDLRMMSIRKVRDEFGDPIPLLRGDSELSGQTGFIEFTRSGWRNPAGLPRSNLQHVIYTFERGKLQRLHTIFLDQATNSPKIIRTLLEDMENMSLAFLDKNDQWKNTWGTFNNSDEEPFPRAIRIRMELESFGIIERLIIISADPGVETKEEEQS